MRKHINNGFSLVELMVAMVIGMLAILVISNAGTAFEAQRRTTTTKSDSQQNGLMAFNAVEADARVAGYGLVMNGMLTCSNMIYYEKGMAAPASAPVAPVVIQDGGAAGASDALTFTGATSTIAGSPSILTRDMPTSISDANLNNSAGMTIDQDLYLVAYPLSSPGTGQTQVPCARLGNTSSASSPVAIYNSSSTTFFPQGGYPANVGYVIDIGSGLSGAAGFQRNKYYVDVAGGKFNLVSQDWSHINYASASSVIASNIANMQAQYGVAPANATPGASSPGVTCWTDARGSACAPASGDWANPSPADIMRIKAIRLAVVARSTLVEKPSVANGPCDATTVAPSAWTGGPPVDLSADPQWQCHRYTVYQTIIPLRNVIWGNV